MSGGTAAAGGDSVSRWERSSAWQEALARMARTLAQEEDPSRVAQTVVDLAVEELGANTAGVWVARPEEETLEELASRGSSAETAGWAPRVPFDAPSAVARAAATRRLQILGGFQRIPESERSARRLLAAAGLRSMVAVPLLAGGTLVGVLGFATRAQHRWTQDELTLVTTLADLLASAISKGRLLEQSEQRRLLAEALIASMADAVFLCDPQGKIRFINSAGLEMLGVAETGDLKTLSDHLTTARVRYLNGQAIPVANLAISRALRGEVVRGMEEMVFDPRARRDRYLLVSASPVRDVAGNLLGAVEAQSDITRLKELDLLKDQFITVAAHEIKTPVTAIKGFAQALARSPDAWAPAHQRALETIVRQSDRLDALVQDFLDVSRMRWGRVDLSRQRIDLSALVAEVLGRAETSKGKHRMLLLRRDPVWVSGDRERLGQVLENLLDNAIRYSPTGGRVEVRVIREIDRALVSVRDEGVGIPREKQPHIFERFYRAHMGTPFDYGGLGVGLYISREIVRHHGGVLWFESEEEKGSTFYFSLPLVE